MGFKKVETFIDLDGDGKPDVGGKKGTSGADKIEGSEMDEKLEGAKGADVLSGGKGDDYLIGGEGADTLIGGNGVGAVDTASFEGSASNYTIAVAQKWVGVKADGTYETDANGDIKIFTASNVEVANIQRFRVTVLKLKMLMLTEKFLIVKKVVLMLRI